MPNPLIRNRETRAIPASEVRVAKNDAGTPTGITGYAAMFDSLSEPLRAGKTQFREKIARGAFADAIAASDVRALYNHDPNHVLGRTKNGTLSLTEDERGLRFDVAINPNDPEAMSVAAKIERGDVDGCSFGFRVADGGDKWEQADGQTVRTIERFGELYDVGPVTYPAYGATSVDVRAGQDARALMTMEYDDPSVRYACRCLIDYSRATFDRLQCVLDCVAGVQGELTPADMEAADDAVSSLVDLIAKAKRCKGALMALGAEDETDAAIEPVENASAASVDDSIDEEAGMAPAEDDEARMAHLMRIQRTAESGRSVAEMIAK